MPLLVINRCTCRCPSFQVDGVTYTGEGRSKKQAKLVAAKNALSTFLLEQHALQDPYVTAPFPTIEFNRGAAIVDVDFTSDDPGDANFIIQTMNRIQTAPNQSQVPLLTTGGGSGPLSALPSNGEMRAPPSIKSGKEEEAGGVKVDASKIVRELEAVSLGKENHNDSGHVEPEGEEFEEALDAKGGFSEEEEDEEEEEEDDSGIELIPDLLEIIRISVEHYIDYESEIQCKYFGRGPCCLIGADPLIPGFVRLLV